MLGRSKKELKESIPDDLLFGHGINVFGLPGGSVVKNPPANAGDVGSIPRSRRSPGIGNGNPFQYSCLENSMAAEPGGLQPMGSQSQTRLSN